MNMEEHESFRDRRILEAVRRANHRMALEREHGVTGHPKAEMVYELAWEYGHANGYGEVATIYDDLVELIK